MSILHGEEISFLIRKIVDGFYDDTIMLSKNARKYFIYQLERIFKIIDETHYCFKIVDRRDELYKIITEHKIDEEAGK